MACSRVLVLGAALALLLAASLGLMSGPGLAKTANHLVISEVLYGPPQTGTDTSYEYECWNAERPPIGFLPRCPSGGIA